MHTKTDVLGIKILVGMLPHMVSSSVIHTRVVLHFSLRARTSRAPFLRRERHYRNYFASQTVSKYLLSLCINPHHSINLRAVLVRVSVSPHHVHRVFFSRLLRLLVFRISVWGSSSGEKELDSGGGVVVKVVER